MTDEVVAPAIPLPVRVPMGAFDSNMAIPVSPDDPSLAEARERYNQTKGRAVHEHQAHEVIGAAVSARNYAHDREGVMKAAEPTGVRLKSPTSGRVQDIYNDGSVRNLWQRRPGVTGRQFRKMRKQAMREHRAAEAKAVAPIIELLPVISGHRHIIGENLQPQCGCVYTPEALVKLRALVAAGGTVVAAESMNPESSTSTQE